MRSLMMKVFDNIKTRGCKLERSCETGMIHIIRVVSGREILDVINDRKNMRASVMSLTITRVQYSSGVERSKICTVDVNHTAASILDSVIADVLQFFSTTQSTGHCTSILV